MCMFVHVCVCICVCVHEVDSPSHMHSIIFIINHNIMLPRADTALFCFLFLKKILF